MKDLQSFRRSIATSQYRTIQGRHPSKAASCKWDGRVFGAFPGCVTRCSRLYPYIMISATQAREIKCEKKNILPRAIFDFLLNPADSGGRGEAVSLVYFWLREQHGELNPLVEPAVMLSLLSLSCLQRKESWDM